MSKNDLKIQLLYSFAILVSPPADMNFSWSFNIPSTVRLVEGLLDDSGLLLCMLHHRQL